MHSLNIMLQVALRSWRKTIRRPVVLTFSFLQPLMWMLFFGFLMQRFPLEGLPASVTYISFLLPGICCMTVLFGASQSGISLIRDMQSGFLQRSLATPAPTWAMHLGKVGADCLRLVIQAWVVILLGILLGAQLNTSLSSLISGFAALLLFGLGFASLSCFIALKTRRQESMAAFVHVINMPIFFTSTALVPSKQMPAWLAGIAQYNPLTLAVESFRSAILFDAPVMFTNHISPLLAISIILVYLAIYSMKRVLFENQWETR